FSPDKQSGKSVCLQLLNLLACKTWMPSGIGKSRIMSEIAKSQPVLLLDDWHTLFGSSDAQPIIGFLNAGSTGGLRHVFRPGNERPGDDDSPSVASPIIYCPKAFAGLGDLPSSLADRCIPIALQRKKPDERVLPFWLDVALMQAAPLVKPL